MTKNGEENEQEWKQGAAAAEAGQKEGRELKEESTGDEQMSNSRMAHLLAVYQSKVQDSKRVIARLKRQKDSQLQAVISQLLLLEAQLRKEQKGIVSELAQRDHVILAQRQEIDRLRRDNRRLINKLKKMSEVCAEEPDQVEPRLKMSRVEPCEESAMSSASRPETESVRGLGVASQPQVFIGLIRVATSVSQLINCSSESSFLKPQQMLNDINISNPVTHSTAETVNPNVASVRATTDRVFHKPPIAEKPRVTSRVARGQHGNLKGQQHLVRSYGGKQCTIVSTISRLLEEESDATTTGSSGSSEPSSPEATLKLVTPRVIRLAKQYEDGLNTNSQNMHIYNNQGSADSSPESLRHEDRNSKSYIMDEYEVTSGYNSDAISDHEYENIRVLTQGSSDVSSKHGMDESQDEEEDNYVVLRAVKENQETGNWVDVPEDQHIYSNVEFASGLMVKEVDEDTEKESETSTEEKDEKDTSSTGSKSSLLGEGKNNVLETNLDSLDSSASENQMLSESLRTALNVPRSRHNINLIMETDGDHMTENFEEFTLDSLELEEEHDDGDRGRGKENLPISEQRRCGDGAETKLDSKMREEAKNDNANSASAAIVISSGQYEKFLEATGLSQKSILTPTRMFSNHRSMLKPRDIKHRNKLRAAFTTLSTLEETPGSGGVYKYWTEPYL
ncbi:LOW QUALITY PROTEIN: uncharacterized protein LOC125029673 [Penaeus chinensis]|uniref:LOW QUALITY PROTEIN: uncharacterized protein LOC125029673 n=1 Tax=Penaeus chinensis TaxID=139456 RepID=UPI001FB6EDBD|nr:LOW QUALITY PROTEIN: uncharacterized protein LOC125029673 [Penaeus chinensis]